MTERGVFAIDRGIWDHPSFADEPFTEREAWAWLISGAAFKACRTRIDKRQITLERGQYAASIRFLADRWKWHRASVERFMARLRTDSMIETDARQGVSVITICNYDKYQIFEFSPDSKTGTQPRHNRDKEESKEKKESDSSLRSESDSDSVSSLRSETESRVTRSREKTKSNGSKLPPDWKPNARHYEEGAKYGLTRAGVDERAAAMREWCEANAHRPITTKTNWDAAFMGTWIRGRSNRGAQLNGKKTLNQAADDLLDQIRAFDEPVPGDLCDGAGEDAVRRLPQGRRE